MASQSAVPQAAPAATPSDRDWTHSKNALGIARLLAHEGRSPELVGTACRMALDAACRVVAERTGFVFDGNVERSLGYLSAPEGLLAGLDDAAAAARLQACERALSFVSSYLRSASPERSWAI